MNNLTTHWTVTDYRGDKIIVDYHPDDMRFVVSMTRGKHLSVQTYDVFTSNEVQRRLKFLNEGKNPCGRWTDRNGKKFCFENGAMVM